jgi:hypothetical protein
MKVIELLNRIANEEELPNKIRFNNIEWNRVYGEKNVCYIDEYDSDFFLYFFRNNLNFTLNDEVEIIEKPKNIKKLDENNTNVLTNIIENRKKINEIIDKLNSMEK